MSRTSPLSPLAAVESVDRREAVVVPAEIEPAKSYSCVRSLSRRGLRTVVAAADERLPAAASRFCDEAVTLPHIDGDYRGYREMLLELARRPDVTTILPVHPQDPYLLARYRERFEEYVDLAVPPLETLRTVHDRLQLAEAAEAAGVPVPETWSLDAVDCWDVDAIVKSRYNLLVSDYVDSFPRHDLDVVKTVRFVRRREPDRSAIREEMRHVPIVQEYVPSGGEYAFCALYDHGEPVATFQHRQIRGDSYTHGGGVYRESVHDPELERVGRALLDSLDWHGLACIEYRRDATTGEFNLLEVNPRVWQSVPCAIRAGADFPYWYWLQTQDRVDAITPAYERGVGTHMLHGELGHLRSVLRDDSPFVDRPSFAQRLHEVVVSCYQSPRFDDVRLDDPLPSVMGLAYLLGLY
jgi:predicted ATP-grasp superfamily ATP-dependent carboligase